MCVGFWARLLNKELKCRCLGGWMPRGKGKMQVWEIMGFGPQAYGALVPWGSVISSIHPNSTPTSLPHMGPAEHQA